MTKENFINKWAFVYNVNDTTNPYFVTDLEAVIANEIAKAQEVKLEDAQPQPAINTIEQAYERGEKIRHKGWYENSWIQKLSETESIDELKNTYDDTIWAFRTEPHKWELYTEPEQVTDQVTDHEQPVMTEKEKIDYILKNKLTWNPMGNKRFYANWFSAESDEGYRQVHFVDYNNPHSGYYSTRIFNIDLSEWQPVEAEKPNSQVKHDNSFDKERFERMFCAVVASGEFIGLSDQIGQTIGQTMINLKQLDAYYASKEGGSNG